MKAIQFTIEEALLERLDADPEVQEDGRSAVLRRAIKAYLKNRRQQQIARAYREGYGNTPADELPSELQGWTDEGVWPNE